MKRFSTILVALLCTVSTIFADLPFRNHRYDAFKVLPVNSEQIVFIGNSITNMNEWWEAFGDHNVVNRGVSGAITDEALANIEAIAAGKPKKVFMMLGTNDLGTAGICTPEHVLQNVALMVERLQAVTPTTKIYIQSLLPSGHTGSGGTRTEARLKATNEALKALCEEKEITYIDLWDDLTDVATNSNGFSYDKLHLTADAYKVWCDKVAPYVTDNEEAKSAYTDNAQSDGGLGGAYGMRTTVFSKLPVDADDILIVGDEMIHGGEWHELLKSARVKGRGTAWGYPGPNVVDMQKMIPAILHDGATPAQVFLYTGVGPVNSDTDLTTIFTNYKNTVAKILELSPTTRVTLMSLQPTTTAATNSNRVVPFNALLKEYADESTTDNVEYLDIYTDFVTEAGVANTAYFTGNYLYGKGYVKVAQKLAAQINKVEPTANITALTDEEGNAAYTRFANRTALGNAIVKVASLPEGDGVGQYTSANLADVKTQIEAAYTALANSVNATDEFTSQVEALTAATNTLLPKINQPAYSTEDTEVWYQLYTPNRGSKYLTSNGVGTGTTGTAANNYATSMWKFVERTDKSLDIINRHDNSYLAPTAAGSTQLTTSEAQPTAGWTLSHSDAPGLFIASSGTVQLHQTNDAAIWNWGGGANRSDAGCQYMVSIVTSEPDEIPDPSLMTMTLTPAQFASGTSTYTYHGNTTSGGWYGKLVTGTTPALTIESTDEAANNIGWSNNRPWLKAGYTYNLTLAEGYYIVGYELTTLSTSSNYSNTFTYTTADGTATSEAQHVSTARTVAADGLSTNTVTLTVNGEATGSSYGILITNLVIRYKEADDGIYSIEIKESTGAFATTGSYAKLWNYTPTSGNPVALTLSCGANNMNVNGGYLQLHSGQAGSSTYTIAVPEPYVITGYSFGYAFGSSGTGDKTITVGEQQYAVAAEKNTLSVSDLKTQSTQFTLAGSNEPVKLTDFVVNVINPEMVGEEEQSTEITYIIDKTNGSLYHKNGSENQAWNNTWKSQTEPQLLFGCGDPNNMNWVNNNLQMMTGSAGTSTYTLTAPTGYVIAEYSFTFANNGHDTGLSLTMDNGAVYTTSKNARTISGNNMKASTVSFVLAGSNGKGVVLTDFTVKVVLDVVEAPKVSTEGNVYWYYITSASTKDYCKGKVMYYDSETQKMRFGEKAFSSNYIWSFWEKDGKLAIKNYRGEYFGTPGNGTGNSTSFGVVSEPNYIYNINEAYDFFVIKDDKVELHAQNDNKVIVRWGAEAGGASLWRFDEVDVSNAAASLASTIVVQGKVSTGIGNVDQPIIRSTLRVSGLEGNVNFQGVKGKFIGTDKADITNVKAYFATNARELFIDAAKKMTWREENGVQYGQAVTLAEDGTFTITGTKDLEPGDYYLWITYDIAQTAKEGNLVDAQITSYTVDDKEIAEDNGNPRHSVTVFLSEGAALMPMDKGSLYYRIPAITVTKDGKRLVILTDDRKQHNSDLPSHCYLVAQYSDDNGKTWSNPVTVAGTAETGGNYGHGDASIVTNRDNGDIIGIMTSAGTYGHGFFAGTAAEPPRWKTIVSHDGGETWETPVDHTDDLFGANCDNPDTKTWKSGFSGSGAALQKRDGTLVSNFVNRQADNSQHFYFFMSKDGGKNWYVSGTSGTAGADEPKSLERNNGDLAISVRAGGYNYYNYTTDDGATWKKPSQTRFTSGISGNACDGEYMVWCSTVEGNPWDIALQTIPNSGSRENVSIALSTDEGATFGTPKTICPRGSAYSAAVVLPDGTLGVYYEENGVFGGYTMRFVRFSLDWASDGQFKFTEEAPFKPIVSTAAEEAKVESTINAQGIGTFYANAATTIPEGVKAYVATEEPAMDGTDAEGNNVGTITMTEITDDIIPAKTGVVLRGEANTTFNFFYTAEDGATETEGNMLRGYAGATEYREVTLPEDYATYVLAVENEIAGFYRKDAPFKVYNHKAYLNVPVASGANALRIRFGDEETTEIESSKLKIDDSASSAVYDLQGRRVLAPTKGIYVVNGKKLVIK